MSGLSLVETGDLIRELKNRYPEGGVVFVLKNLDTSRDYAHRDLWGGPTTMQGLAADAVRTVARYCDRCEDGGPFTNPRKDSE